MVCVSSLGFAQAPAPDPHYTGSFGGGLALTSGNTDTKSFNLALSLVHDAKTRNIEKLTALYLRGTQNKILSVNRASVILRDEFKLSGRAFLFGQGDYLSDRFKDISYLVAPVGGLGYKFFDSDETKFQVSGGAGGIWEKNGGIAVEKSGSVSAGEDFSQKISSTSKFTQSIGALWKTKDFKDSLTNVSLGLTTSVSKRLELKVEFLDSYKNRPPNSTIKKNDTAFVVAFVFKL
jgi:putative salt-induced outer membrane protein